MILTKDLASRVLQRNLSELILLANGSAYSGTKSQSQFQTSVCKIRIPDTIEIIEAVCENESPSSFRKNGKLIEDKKITKRLIEKSLELSIKKATGIKKMRGIFLLEDPIPLYRCERAKLFLGFSACVNLIENEL